ncbi:MAG: hypothetical protein JWM97_2468 [Phycisphaerales bacterium]|nr:hypothetical protein [Phycisphaerales bacterium]
MSQSSWIARAATVAASVICPFVLPAASALAGEPQPTEAYSPQDLSLGDQPLYLDENLPSLAPNAAPLNPSDRPLMDLINHTPLGRPMQEARINAYGWAQASYNYNFMNPAKSLNLGRVFDINDNRFQINQIDLAFERKVDLSTHQLDVGGRLEMLYGTDARFIHSNGMFDFSNRSNSGSSVAPGPEYQFDIPQLYADVGVPIGNGLRIRAGKFLFFKQIDPNASVFFSHSYTFGGALPFTLTGVTGYYEFCDTCSFEGGISRGWGQSLKDNNGAINGLGRVRYSMGKSTDLSLALVTGPELDHDNSHYRTVLDATLTHQLSDRLTVLADGVYGHQALPGDVTSASWYGVSGYGVYKFSDQISTALRLEWYRDEEGFTTGIAQNLYEATAGLTLTPFPNDAVGQFFRIRPEVRYDYSSRNFFDGFRRHDQVTVAIDAVFNF